jgi:hypothetical protein
MVLIALGSRAACPRLPRLGEHILTRSIEEAGISREASIWVDELVSEEGHYNGVHTESRVPSNRTIVRGTFRGIWVYPDKHKFGNWKDD